jgi:hypothetical protein
MVSACRRWHNGGVTQRRAASFGALLFVLMLGASASAASGRVLLLTSAAPEVSASSFALALRLQLQPFGVELVQSSWSPSESFVEQRESAGKRAREAGLTLVAWYVLRVLPSGRRELLAFLSDLSQARQGARFLALAGAESGIERSMASTLATLIVATVRGEPVRPGQPIEALRSASPATRQLPVTRPAPVVAVTRPAAGPTAPASRRRAVAVRAYRLVVLGSYGLAILPVGAEVRHGPAGALGVRVWRNLTIELGAAFRLTTDGSTQDRTWSRRIIDLRSAVAYDWALRYQLAVGVGVAVRASAVRAEASAAGRSESATAWELGIGPRVGLSWRIRPYLSVVAHLLAGWVPIGHQLVVGGDEVGRPGGLELSLSSGLQLALW